MRTLSVSFVSSLLFVQASIVAAAPAPAVHHGMAAIAREPYIGTIAVDAASGRVLLSENPDAAIYPASCIKLMSLLVVLDAIDQNRIHLVDPVRITNEAASIGGSQVYLKGNEVFTVEELIYALMVKSANDAATALAIHVAGSQAAFVELMNRKAQELGLTRTRFYSCHGLPPTPPRTPDQVDVSTPRELAALARMLVLEHPETLRYSSTVKRTFRNGTFEMVNHDKLLGNVPGVDGLKTGWFPAAGYSIVATARRDGRRVIVVVAGSVNRLVRDRVATEDLARGFAALPPPPRDVPATNIVAAVTAPGAANPEPSGRAHSAWRILGIGAGVLVAAALIATSVMLWRRRANADLPPSTTTPLQPRLPPKRR
jgi:D-alanyl-D-alanine carboxypeptidase (penicillin-binding protein 5/6)